MPTIARPTRSEDTLLIGLVGDVMLGRLVNDTISTAGYAYPWGDVLDLLKHTDMNIINLETTLTNSTKAVPKVFHFKADPDRIQTLREARIDVCNLANNHILDYSAEGLIETVSVLDAAGIEHVGAGLNAAHAARPVIIMRRNLRIGVIGCTDNEPAWAAGEDKPGVHYVRVDETTAIEKQVAELNQQVDILILTIHWGPNLRDRPPREFRELAHRVVDAGVDILHGHSAHIFQGIEVYHRGLILYDTGDFVDDYYVDPDLRNDQSFLYIVEADRSGLRCAELIPVLISEMQVNQATGVDYRETVERLKVLSQELGTPVEDTDQGLYISLDPSTSQRSPSDAR